MIKSHIELGGKLEIIDFKVDTKKEAIEKIWETYGMATPIIDLFDEMEVGDSVGNTSE